ncbi:glyoxylate/hydroxypyruvate reductase A [Thioclava sp. SK-1]|uniref:2-hydroxyacid dehydrogenase n=1 Tax=Thioclava sp. SK-1 TaxID=1889770 RepID=UPI000825983B|nr:glyoxylate/hydroxypyruvate reductase A [Thioclava sp. SK-1]OCX67248.1 glyoxylate/hydroxypyruvate reductase A [Thioclava sp. SK-1]
MIVAIYLPSTEKTQDWCAMMGDLLPDWQVVSMHDDIAVETVDFALVWRPRTGDLARFTNLKAIVSIGAGIDHVVADAELPRHVPIIRTVGTDLTQRMREYVALHVLRHHRNTPALAVSQAASKWAPIVVPPAPKRRVGVMGLGNLGAQAAKTLSMLGFDTVGWARSGREIEGVTCYSGPEQFDEFLTGTEILVNLLPLTDPTRGILNAGLFNRLARGACVINAARGPHMVDQDLLAALASGQVAQATLDVFHIEPLPEDHPFWSHPQITVTPHVASLIDAPTGSRIIAKNLRDFAANGTVDDIADANRGY